MASSTKQALRRLMKDQAEMTQSPVTNVSAAPLDTDMFEWHCNIRDGNNIFHVILFFPENYPYSSPSAEFVPSGFNYSGGAIKKGKKGDQICLSIFSDFASYHREWEKERGSGWSPGYTAQTVLLNVISFLADANMHAGSTYQKISRTFKCPECGHVGHTPFPPLPEVDHNTEAAQMTANGVSPDDDDSKTKIASQIVDYISKEKFKYKRSPKQDELFGFGLVLNKKGRKVFITTPCEFLTSGTFYGMKSSSTVVHSVLKQTLSHFLPLYINDNHGHRIKEEVDKTLQDVKDVVLPHMKKATEAEIIMELIPNLMCSTVVEFSKGMSDTSENSLRGYFALHRLFLWMMEAYPELEKLVDDKLSEFVTKPSRRHKDACPDIGQWLMLLSVSPTFTWSSVSEAYLSECCKRNVMWYLDKDDKLDLESTSPDYRLKRTFELTDVSRNLLTFQVAFLRIARPQDMSKSDILERYEANLGFPSGEMVEKMKDTCRKVESDIKSYGDWYQSLGLPTPTKDAINAVLKDAVCYAKATTGYHFTHGRRVPNNNSTNNNSRPDRHGGQLRRHHQHIMYVSMALLLLALSCVVMCLC